VETLDLVLLAAKKRSGLVSAFQSVTTVTFESGSGIPAIFRSVTAGFV
jgi:hypothetical protein